jgi:hypothetical protein
MYQAQEKFFHLCKWRFIGDVPFQYRQRGLGGPPMLGSPLAPAGGTELLAHLHRSISVPRAVASGSERGLGGPPMLGSPLAPAGGTELLAHLHRWKFFVPKAEMRFAERGAGHPLAEASFASGDGNTST